MLPAELPLVSSCELKVNRLPVTNWAHLMNSGKAMPLLSFIANAIVSVLSSNSMIGLAGGSSWAVRVGFKPNSNRARAVRTWGGRIRREKDWLGKNAAMGERARCGRGLESCES